MASRDGPRAAGTDGYDFTHRERVASHYTSSVENKKRLKLLIMMHLTMALLMTVRLSTAFFVMFGFRPPTLLQRLRLPRPQSWEFVWLISFIPSVFGLISLRRNRIFLMQQYLIGTVIFGILPAITAMYNHSDELMEYGQTRASHLKFLGYPAIVVWYMFLVISLQLSTASVYFSYQLLKAWKAKGEKKY